MRLKTAGLTLLKIALAAVLVVYVLGQIETRDLLHRPGPGGELELVPGHIEGNWQAGDWRFLPGDGTRPLAAGDLGEGWGLRPGFFTLLRGIRLELYFLAVVCWTLLVLIVTLRWRILLRAAGVESSYGKALRLCFVGYFFNNAMPGLTGGDLVRAVLVTRGLESRRARAAMSVLVDRLLGLFSLLLLAGMVLLFHHRQGGQGPEHMDTVRRGVFLILAGAAAGGAIYLSRRARRVLHLDALLARLPAREVVARLDEAITVYRGRPGAVVAALLLSMLLQACGVLSFWAVSRSLGAELTVADDFVVFPVVQTVSSVPVSPAGWGIGEGLYGKFFEWFGSTFTLGVAASILFRLTTQVGFGLLGGLVWVLSRERSGGELQAVTGSGEVPS